MKRFLIISGTMLYAILPGAAHAYMPPDCERIQAVSAISPYVEQVLERAQEGLDAVRDNEKSPSFAIVFAPWLQESLATVASTIDVQTGVISLRPNLRNATTCRALDELQLQCALAEAREALITQIGNESIFGIFQAQALVRFLQERVLAFQAGADDGTWLDRTALNRQLFDTRAFPAIVAKGDATCGDNKKQPAEECEDGNTDDGDGCSAQCLSEMCPYTSDYGEAVPSRGLGCDLYILNEEDATRGTATDVIEQESAALQNLMDARDELIDTEDDPDHAAIEGCVRGWCENDEETACGKSADCGDGGRCVYGRRVCEKDTTLRCSSDDACGDMGPCTFVANTRVTTPRGAFALEEDATKTVATFVDLWRRQGLRRAWPDALKIAADFPVSERTPFMEQAGLGDASRLEDRNALRADQEEQGVAEAMLFATALDGHLEIATELLPLRDGVRRLGLMARERDGARQIVRNLAYYILRSCIHRSCNEKLLQILQVTYTDECYVHTNGEYLTYADPWLACTAAAGL